MFDLLIPAVSGEFEVDLLTMRTCELAAVARTGGGLREKKPLTPLGSPPTAHDVREHPRDTTTEVR
ncbi:hypothetical protein ABT143_08520 [Streptomyces sp. NPDC002033]|uniref:hypothetical protein n=1 Tax=unclassified Streptomyces TaxID=2593676 RepID=UPI003321C5A1